MTSIFKDDQYFDHEINFCIAFGIKARRFVEREFLKNRISYFIKVRRRSIIRKILSGWRAEDLFIVRINDRDVERAIPLVDGQENVEIVARPPAADWSPKMKLERLERERENAEAGTELTETEHTETGPAETEHAETEPVGTEPAETGQTDTEEPESEQHKAGEDG
ncbi:MAG: hypothetical protein J6P87_10025 [Lachnospiraceae bacterium]|nr:hypothetical protein [Lachnospiraceae bacterium]